MTCLSLHPEWEQSNGIGATSRNVVFGRAQAFLDSDRYIPYTILIFLRRIYLSLSEFLGDRLSQFCLAGVVDDLWKTCSLDLGAEVKLLFSLAVEVSGPPLRLLQSSTSPFLAVRTVQQTANSELREKAPFTLHISILKYSISGTPPTYYTTLLSRLNV